MRARARAGGGGGGGGGGGVTGRGRAGGSRALEAWLDDGGPLGPRYVLEVSSPGLERPLRWPRHWARFVGRDVTAKLAGLGRVRARIVAVADEGTGILPPEGGGPRAGPLAGVRDRGLSVGRWDTPDGRWGAGSRG